MRQRIVRGIDLHHDRVIKPRPLFAGKRVYAFLRRILRRDIRADPRGGKSGEWELQILYLFRRCRKRKGKREQRSQSDPKGLFLQPEHLH